MRANEPKRMSEMQQDVRKWIKRGEELVDCHGDIDFQSDFIKDLSEITGYHPDAYKAGEMFHTWEHDKVRDIITYRDQQFKSLFSGTVGTKHNKWLDAFDDSIAAFVN